MKKSILLLIVLMFGLSININAQNSNENLPEYYWTDLVTSQPEGYVVDGNGDVLITTAEGMAWLISTVNGLNGQDANDYEDVVIRLENDIDISGNIWTSIGTENNPFKGIFDGQGFDINGIYMNNAEEGRNYGLFGYINNAVIKDLVLGKGTIVGYEECGGIACFADNMSLIDRCIVKTTMEYSHNSGGVVGINRDSKISNSTLMSEMFSTAETYVGGIVGQNISANADAIIENCFATSMFGSSYSTFFAAGIAARNISEGNDYKAIIRNCYSAPISMYGELCGGIVGYNSENSLIENSYCKNSSDYALCGENHGEIVNCSVFSSSDMEFINMVEVFGTETYYLLDALNIWVDNYSEGEYLSWVVGDVNINYGYPYFVENIDNIAEISNDIISIYPNPTENNITIEAEDIIQIEVYNTLGQMVARIGAEGNSVELDMSDYSDGIYLIKTVSKEGSTVSRVVKM